MSTHTPEACPLCHSRALVCRPVLDSTVARHEPAVLRDVDPDLWWHFHCCDGCHVAWMAGWTRGDDLGVMDSERHDAALRDYRIVEPAHWSRMTSC